MNEKLGLLALAAFIIAVIGLWNFAIRMWAASHPDSGFAQGVIHYY